MKTIITNRRAFILATSIASLFATEKATLATSGDWLGTTSATWADDTNWTNPFPVTGNTATFNGTGNLNVIIDLGAGVTVNTLAFDSAAAAAYTIGTSVAGSQSLTLDNAGSLTLSSTVAANQLVNAALTLGNDGSTQSFTLSNASTTNSLTIAGGIIGSTGAGVKTIAVSGAGATTLSGIIGNGTTGTVALTKANAGILTLSNTNTYSGGTTVSGGIVNASLAGALGTGAVTNNGTLSLTATTAGDITYTGLSTSMSGAGILNVSLLTGSSTRILNGSYSAFNGTINVGVGTAAGGGKVQLNGADHTDAVVNVNTNATLYVVAAVTKNAELVLNGGDTGESLGQLRLEGGAIWAGGVTLAGNLAAGDFTIGGNGAGTISGVISETGGSRALSKGGNGTMTLSNANTYTGTTTVGGGVLLITNNSALGTSSAGVFVGNATALSLGAGITTPSAKSVTIIGTGGTSPLGALRAESGTSTWAGNVIIGSTADTRVGANAGATLNITGSILGSGAGQAINISGGSGTGKVVLNPTTNNNYAGGTSVYRGILELGKSNIIPDTSALQVGVSGVTDAATFSMAGFSETVFSLAHGSDAAVAAGIKVTNSGGAAVLTLDGTGGTASTTFGGNIESTTPANLSLVKKGGTTQVLTGTNTFTGGVTVNGGTLGLNFTGTIPAAAPATNILAAANVLTLGNGSTSLLLTGKSATANAQTVASTTLNTGGATITTARGGGAANTMTLTAGALTRNTGATVSINNTVVSLFSSGTSGTPTLTLASAVGFVAGQTINGTGAGNVVINSISGNVLTLASNLTATAAGNYTATGVGTGGASSSFITNTANVNGILGGYATVNTSVATIDWAVANGASAVTPFATYTALAASGGAAATNYQITGLLTQTVSQSVNSLKLAGASTTTLTLGATDLTISSGGILTNNTNISQNITGTTGGLIAANNELILHANSTGASGLTISAPIKDNGANAVTLTKAGAQTLFLSATNTYTGSTILNSGTLSIASEANLGATPGAVDVDNLVLNSGTLATTGTIALGANRGVQLNGVIGLTPSVGTTLTIPGIIAGSGVLTKNTAGSTLILSGANSFTGPATGLLGALGATLTLNGGTVVLAHPSAAGVAGNGIAISTGASSFLELATDSTVNAYSLNMSSANAGTIILSRATPGAAFNHTLGIAAVGSNVMNVFAGSNLTSGTPSISLAGVNLTSGAAGTHTMNPVGTTISVLGPVFIGNNSFTKTLGLAGNTTGNSVAGDISNGLNTVSLAKSDTSTWTVSGNNSFTGTTSVTGGTLKLDYSTNNTSKLADGAALTLGGSTLEISGGSHNEVVSATTLTANTVNKLTRTGGSTGVTQLNAITGNTGSMLNIAGSSFASTDTLNTNGILGPWATVTDAGVTDWAINSTNVPDGLITAYSAYTDIARLADGTPAGVVPNTAAANVRIVESGTAGNITLAAATTQINTLKMQTAGGAAVIALAGQALSIGGNTGGTILLDSLAGALTVGSSANNGTLTTGGTADAVAASLHFANMSATNALTINSAIANNGTDVVSVAKSGAGKLTLAGTNTFTGTVSVGEGVLAIGNAAALPATTALTLGANTTLDLNGNNSTITNLIGDSLATITSGAAGTGTDTLTVTTTLAAVVPSLITDGATRKVAVVLDNNNSNHLMLSNVANTFSGGLTLMNGARLSPAAGLNGVVGSPGAIVSGPWGRGAITVGQAATDTTGIFFGTANITLVNDIVANTLLGTDRPGTIRVDTTGNVVSGTLTANLSPFGFGTNGTGSVTATGKITGSNGLSLVSGTLGGTTLTVTLANTGTASDYAGNTLINDNAQVGRSFTLALGAANQLPNGTGKGNVVITTNGTGVGSLTLGGFAETINGLSGNGTVTSTAATTLTVGDNNADGAANTFSGTVTGAVALTKTGTGTLILSGVNTYTGATIIDAGIVKAGNAAALGGTGAGTTVNPNGTLDFNGIAGAAEAITLAGGKLTNTGADQINAAGGATTVTVNSKIGGTNRWDYRAAGASLTVNSGITLTKEDANAIVGVNRPVTNNGTVQINAGVFAFHLPGTYGGTGNYVIGASGELQLGAFGGGTTLTLPNNITSNGGILSSIDSSGAGGAPDFSGDITLTAATTTTFRADQAGIVTGDIIGDGALTKTGAGTHNLVGANTYTGATLVSAGTLNISGSLSGSSSVTVDGATAILSGGGSITGPVSVLNGGKLAPGNSPGILATGALSMVSGTALNIEINGLALGTQYDQLSVSGAVNITGATLSLSGTYLTTPLVTNDFFTILLNDGDITDPITGTFAGLAEGAHVFSGLGQDYTISYVGGNGNDIVLTAVPEPGSAALLLGGLGALVGLRRRRRA